MLFQVEQGYALDDIRKALAKFGYKKQVISEILDRLHISFPKKRTTMYTSADLDAELRIYVQSLLIDYIVKEHKVGYSLEAIKRALINFGHDPKLIDEAIVIIESGKVVDYRKESSMVQFAQQIVASVTLFLIFAFLVFLSIVTDTSILKILPNFLPVFLAYFIVNAAFFFMPKTKLTVALPLFAVLITVGVFIVGIQYGFLGTVPGSDMVLLLNAVAAFISTGIVCAFSKKGKDEVVVHVKDKKQKRLHDKEESLIEGKIQTPKIGAPLPKEPYHVAGHPKMAYESARAVHPTGGSNAMHGMHPSNSNSMLHFLREEIDKKPVAHPHSLQRPGQQQGAMQNRTRVMQQRAQHMAHSAQQKKLSSSHRLPISSVDRLPSERKKKEAKIPLKDME